MHSIPSSKNRWIILAVAVMCPFMATVDASIVNVALPVLAQKLSVDTAKIAWVVSIYLLIQVATLLYFGRLGDRLGRARVFLFGVLLFTIGSVFCSFSQTFPILIAARILQSIGASATLANNQAIISQAFGDGERGRALGINGAFVALGTLIGPSLGGFILSVADWHFLFWINVPIGILVLIAGIYFFPKDVRASGKTDVPGSLLFAGAMIAFFLPLQEIQTLGFSHPLIWTGFAVGILLFLLFIRRQKTAAEPLLNLALFHNRWFMISLGCAFASFVAISCYSLLQPFYLENVRLMSPAAAGLFMSIYPLVLAVISPLSGYLSDTFGPQRLTVIGLSVTAFGLLLMSFLGISTPLPLVAVFVVFMSLGNGMFQSPNTVIVMSSVRPEQRGVAGSMNALARTTGQSVGIALTNVLLYSGISMTLGRHVTDFPHEKPEAFLTGMEWAYWTGFAVCLIGLSITAFRLFRQPKGKNAKKKQEPNH